jgi:hypothetical protein
MNTNGMAAAFLVFACCLSAQDSRPPVAKEQSKEEKAANEKLLAEIKADIDDPQKRAAVRAMLDRARSVAKGMNMAYQADVDKLTESLLFNTLKEGFEAGNAKGEAGDPPGALRAFDAALADFDAELPKAWNRPRTPEIERAHKEIIAASDKLVEKLETPEFEAKIATRDLLDPKERPIWQPSVGAGVKFDGGSAVLEGLEFDRQIMGVVGLGLSAEPPWHDLTLDLEFTIVAGSFELYLRFLPAKPNFLISFAPSGGYELGKLQKATIRIKGRRVELLRPEKQPLTEKFAPKTSRSGGLGFGLEAGSKVVISSCKLKVLR